MAATAKTQGQAFGVDIGGTGIKGAVVDLSTGELVGPRQRVDTPQPSTPEAIEGAVVEICGRQPLTGPIGVTFPGVVTNGIVYTAANVDPSWIGTSLVDTLQPRLTGPVVALNDADAAGLAEVRYGAGRGHTGVVLMITLGTGIGTAIIHNSQLVPNAELGHLELDGHDAESRAAASVRERKGLSYEQWAGRVSRYLNALENLLWPELFILGGGISKKADKWVPLLKVRTPLAVAQMLNNAGIVGAALKASEDQL